MKRVETYNFTKPQSIAGEVDCQVIHYVPSNSVGNQGRSMADDLYQLTRGNVQENNLLDVLMTDFLS